MPKTNKISKNSIEKNIVNLKISLKSGNRKKALKEYFYKKMVNAVLFFSTMNQPEHWQKFAKQK